WSGEYSSGRRSGCAGSGTRADLAGRTMRSSSVSTAFRRSIYVPLITVLLTVGSFLSLQAQQSEAPAKSHAEAIFDSMPRAKAIAEAEISPDGSRVAWITDDAMYVKELGRDASPKSIKTPGQLPVRELAWSPDNLHAAVIADVEGEAPA